MAPITAFVWQFYAVLCYRSVWHSVQLLNKGGHAVVKKWTNLCVGLAMIGCFSYFSAGCSPVMEATRPTPVDISQFAVGESRVNIVEALGAPIANVKNGDQSCDVYKLYTRGPGGVGKGVIAAGEGAADVVTLGLAEVVFTPIEAGTRNAKHTVTFCYDKDGKLLSTNDEPPG